MGARTVARAVLPPALVAGQSRLRRALRLRRRFERLEPFSYGYVEKREVTIAGLAEQVAAGARLDEVGLVGNPAYARVDERVVEYAWTLERLCESGGGERLLDVGCVLNRPYCAPLLGRLFAERSYLNIAYEPLHDAGRASLVVADVRACPLPDGHFDAVTCVSTLEHVGMENALYTPDSALGAASGEPDLWERARPAIEEMRRLLRPGGRLFITVPYGEAEDRGWFHVFGAEEVARTRQLLGEETCSVELYRADAMRGWVPAESVECAGLRYGDGVPAAAAVACLDHRKPS